MTPRGRFIALEGGEGTGKTTQGRKLAGHLESLGLEVVLTREPGGSEEAEHIRNLLLYGDKDRWDAPAELLLFLAARRNHIVKIVEPALAAGKWVITDRYQDSTTAYQGYGHGLGWQLTESYYRIVFGAFHTDLSLIMDIDPKVGLVRAEGVNPEDMPEDRFESRAIAFHARLREGFQDIARRHEGRCVMIDASADIDTVQENIIHALSERLPLPHAAEPR